MKQVQAYLSAREDRESSFHYYGSPVRLMQACLCGGKTWSRPFIHSEMSCKARVDLFICQRRSREQI